MKKSLLLFLLIISSINFVFAQLPCPVSYRLNNGGGNCSSLNGLSATGTVSLSFDGPINSNNIPSISSVIDITDPANPVTVTDIFFGAGSLLNNGSVKYCYYVGPANNNNLQGTNSQFRFVVSYNGTPCGEQGTLPVSFRLFTAARHNNLVEIKWGTSSESNNLGFEIQRLIGTGTWETLSFVTSKAIGGNSSQDLSYAYTDQNASKGITQYRIRQIDIDNRSKLSEIRVVRGTGQPSKTLVYPNPSNDGKVNVVFDDAETPRNISLIDLNGRTMKQWKNFKSDVLQIDNLTTGFYTVRIVNAESGEQIVEKIVVKNR